MDSIRIAVLTLVVAMSIAPLSANGYGADDTDPDLAPPDLTRDHPLVSNLQVIGADGGASTLRVDPGVARVWMDIRQPNRGDSYSLLTPSGLLLETVTTVERAGIKVNLEGQDFIGAYHDGITWNPPAAGEYTLQSTGPHFALARMTRGGRIEVWIDEPVPASRVLSANQRLTVSVSVRDANNVPIHDAQVTGRIKNLTPKGTAPVEIPAVFGPTMEDGVYSFTLPDGLPPSMYSLGITATRENFRRDAAITVAVADRPTKDEVTTPHFVEDAVADAIRQPFRDLVEIEVGVSGETHGGVNPPGTITYFPDDNAVAHFPVIVFIHGIFANSSAWTGPDGMAPIALANGYRVALLDLHPGLPSTTNAPLITQGLADVAEHYDVESVVIVAHSKGGPDTDTALMHFGTQRARVAITLSGALHGTSIADILDHPGIPDWVYARLNSHRDTAIQLTIGFRALWQAGNANNFPVRFHSFNAWGYDFSSEGLGWIYRHISGPYLEDAEGFNDGLVSHFGTTRLSQVLYPLPSPPHFQGTRHNHTYQRSSVRMWQHVENELASLRAVSNDFDNTPHEPTTVVGEVVGCAIDLTWVDNSFYETGFEVRRSVNAEEFDVLTRVAADGQEGDDERFTDEDVIVGNQYRYRIAAYLDRPPENLTWRSELVDAQPGVIEIPTANGCAPQSEEHSVRFNVDVTQPVTGDPQDFVAFVQLHAIEPLGGPVDEIVTINQNWDNMSHTFDTLLEFGSAFTVLAFAHTDYPNGNQVATCDAVFGTGTIVADVTNVQVNCTVWPPDAGPTRSLTASWETNTPQGDPGHFLTADIHAVATPPFGPGSVQGPGAIFGQFGTSSLLQAPQGWHYMVTVDNIEGGSCQVSNASGTFNAFDVDIAISCTQQLVQHPLSFQWLTTRPDGTPGESVSGTIHLQGTPPGGTPRGLQQQEFSGASGGGSFSVPNGWGYTITVDGVSGGTCTVENGTGTINGGPASGVMVRCTENEEEECEGPQCENPDPPAPGGGGRFPPFTTFDQYPGDVGGEGGGGGRRRHDVLDRGNRELRASAAAAAAGLHGHGDALLSDARAGQSDLCRGRDERHGAGHR